MTLYGIADGDFRVDHTSIGTLKSVGSGGESGSRWGMRGTEDLGGGLQGDRSIFEQGIDLSDNSVPQGNVAGTTPNSPTSTRPAAVCSAGPRSSGSGSAAAGELPDRPGLHAVLRRVDARSIRWGGGLVGRAQNYAVGNVTRFDNAIYYDTPKLYGFQITTAYRLGESSTNSVASRIDEERRQRR